MSKLHPLINSPVLIVEQKIRTLVIADIHLGIEWDLYYSGFNIPSQTEKRLDRILKYVDEVKPKKIVLLGDVKHNVPYLSYQEKKEIPYFLEQLEKHAQIEIIPGNHDGGIKNLLPSNSKIFLHGSEGTIIDGIAYFHGHAWPAPELFQAREMIMGHNHPVIKFIDALGKKHVEQAWIKARFNPIAIKKHYKGKIIWKNPRLTIMPAFNELAGGIPFNEAGYAELLGPLFTSNAVKLNKAICYLLDGTYLGEIEKLRA
jgi:putative SbcD/Mre11-related phosphoesterase